MLTTEEPKLEQIGVTCLALGLTLDGGNSHLRLSQPDVLVTRLRLIQIL